MDWNPRYSFGDITRKHYGGQEFHLVLLPSQDSDFLRVLNTSKSIKLFNGCFSNVIQLIDPTVDGLRHFLSKSNLLRQMNSY